MIVSIRDLENHFFVIIIKIKITAMRWKTTTIDSFYYCNFSSYLAFNWLQL